MIRAHRVSNALKPLSSDLFVLYVRILPAAVLYPSDRSDPLYLVHLCVVFGLAFSLSRSAEETLVGKAHYADNEAVETVTMKSVVDSSSGGLSWAPVDAAVAAEGNAVHIV